MSKERVRKISTRLIEGVWNCDKCDNKNIKARYDSCPSCGSRRNSTTRYKMLDKNNYVAKEDEAKINKRPDWLCSYCDNLNRANLNSCESCGASKEDSERNYFENLRKSEEDNNLNNKSNIVNNDISINNKNEIKQAIKKKIKNISKNTKIKLLLSCILIPIIFIFLFLLFKPRVDTITVEQFSWESSVSIEEYKTVNESSWTLPSTARLQYTREEISHYEEVFDHYENRTRTVTKERFVGYEEKVEYKDLGNGYFEENVYEVPKYETYEEIEEYTEAVYKDVPVYKTKYYYEIDKWVYKESVDSNGNDKNPYYPKVTLKDNERISSKSQEYFISGKNSKGKIYTIPINKEKWENLNSNDKVKFKIYFGGTYKVID